MRATVIAAMASNRTIGDDGEIPWHLPEDLTHFRRTTQGHPVIVGRKTYEGIVARLGSPLPRRTNIVLSRDSSIDGHPAVKVARSIDEAMEIAGRVTFGPESEVFIAGGQSVYEQMIPRASRMLITEVRRSVEGDAKFPDFDRDEWEYFDADERADFTIVEYRRQ